MRVVFKSQGQLDFRFTQAIVIGAVIQRQFEFEAVSGSDKSLFHDMGRGGGGGLSRLRGRMIAQIEWMIQCLAVPRFGRVVFVTVEIHGIDRLVDNNWLHFGINRLPNGNGIGTGGDLHPLRRSAFDRGQV